LNGIFLLEAIRELMDLSDVETRLLFTVFTIHDINKDPDYEGQHFNRIAIPTNFQRQVQKLGLDRFFPEYERYLDEITNLASRHGGHSGGLSLAARPSSILERQELERLLMLIRAVDVVDLSQSLEEPKHKHSFLSYFNGVLDDRQYDFYLHQLVEDRGVLSNIVHNAIIQTLQEQGLTPLPFYTDGVAYLIPKGETAQLGQEQRRKMVRRAANAINEMVSRDYMDFIRSGIQGIKVDPKCLELGI